MGYAAALALMLALVIMIVTHSALLVLRRKLLWDNREAFSVGKGYTILVLYAIITFLPFAWALSASFKRYQKLFQVEPILFPNRLHWKTTSKFSAKNHCLGVGYSMCSLLFVLLGLICYLTQWLDMP